MPKGSRHWWIERITAVALIPLTLWFVASIMVHSASDYETFVTWLRMPLPMALMVLMLTVLFRHIALGLRVVFDDYMHSPSKSVALAAVDVGCLAFAALGWFAILSITIDY